VIEKEEEVLDYYGYIKKLKIGRSVHTALRFVGRDVDPSLEAPPISVLCDHHCPGDEDRSYDVCCAACMSGFAGTAEKASRCTEPCQPVKLCAELMRDGVIE